MRKMEALSSNIVALLIIALFIDLSAALVWGATTGRLSLSVIRSRQRDYHEGLWVVVVGTRGGSNSSRSDDGGLFQLPHVQSSSLPTMIGDKFENGGNGDNDIHTTMTTGKEQNPATTTTTTDEQHFQLTSKTPSAAAAAAHEQPPVHLEPSCPTSSCTVISIKAKKEICNDRRCTTIPLFDFFSSTLCTDQPGCKYPYSQT